MTPDLASLLFGSYRKGVLALLLLRPEESRHVREIARALGKPAGTLLRELNALAEAGVLARKPVGNQVHFQANAACPIYEELRSILRKTVGVADVLRDALAALAAATRVAFVYGSVARGEERRGSDLDLMIVGGARFADVVAALAPAQELLRREVNPNVYPALEFRRKLAAGEPFLKRVLAEPKIFIIGGENELGELTAHRKAQGARRR
ncbi:MAG: polymerase subunit beta [Burkholderiales bacterium]|nr:polymerase subunit beta [Burkholderiales bacterium]